LNIRLLLCLALLCLAPGRAARTGYEEVDKRALSAPASMERDPRALVNYLCPAHYTDFQKARSLFRWVSDRIAYDVDGLRHNRLGSQHVEETLRTRKAVCEGYAVLYKELADLAGLQVQMITGASKFNSALPFALPPGIEGHAWNAVLLKGRWRLLDVTWAAGQLQASGQFKRNFDDYWFCTPAEQFVYTHLPKDERWQMLDRAWSQARFDSLPRLSSDFFRLGLKLGDDDVQPLLVAGERSLRWNVPKDIVSVSDLRDAQGRPLQGWTFTQSPQGRIETRVRCPRPGKYTLRIYARRRQPAWAGNINSPVAYPCVAEYQVESRAAASAGFPKTFGSFQRGGAELVKPLSAALKQGSEQQFQVRAPGADEVALFNGGTFLANLSRENGQFRGVVAIPSKGPLQVCARYPQESRYWGLVEYSIR
jgi:hypothetical protein